MKLFGRGQEPTSKSVCAQTVPLTPAPPLTPDAELTDTLETHIIARRTMLNGILHHARVVKVGRMSCSNSA